MKALVNGVERELAAGSTVADVLRVLAAPEKGVAVARGGELVPRADWSATVLAEGDAVEVLTAVQGG